RAEAGPMPRRPPPLSSDRLIAVVALVVLVLLVLWLTAPPPGRPPAPERPPAAAPPEPVPEGRAAARPGGYLFSTWNVETFFDDGDDPKNRDEDEDWFGRNPQLVDRKVKLLADALLLQNGGLGPDVLAMVEVESRRC